MVVHTHGHTHCLAVFNALAIYIDFGNVSLSEKIHITTVNTIIQNSVFVTTAAAEKPLWPNIPNTKAVTDILVQFF